MIFESEVAFESSRYFVKITYSQELSTFGAAGQVPPMENSAIDDDRR